MEKIIQWQSQHLEVDTISHKIIEPRKDDKPEYYDDDGEDIGEYGFDEPSPPRTVTATVFGQFALDDKMHPYRAFELWQADTNFKITKGDWKKLIDINGVEILVPITRYKFMVGVGKLFSFSNVRVDIEFALCQKHKIDIAINHIEDNSLRARLIDIKSKIKNSNSWAIYVFPNGNIDYTTSDNFDYADKLQLYRESYLLSNGLFITNG